MRLLGTYPSESVARRFSAYLRLKGVKHELEMTQNTDWGSPNYSSAQYHIWVIDEDDVPRAQELYKTFQSIPEDMIAETSHVQPAVDPLLMKPQISAVKEKLKEKIELRRQYAPLTIFLVFICSIIFMIEAATFPMLEKVPTNIPITPIATPLIYKKMMYDYPPSYEVIDTLVKGYGIGGLSDPSRLPTSAQVLLQQAKSAPRWNGIYPMVVDTMKSKENKIHFNAPMFEKISEGEVWRLITPIFLHSNIFHLFFNMIWAIVLGRQLEERIGKMKLLLFILLTAAFSNTAQYLMSCPNFIGFSGVICAMVAFIWVKQRYAAWEGYSIQPSTINFVSIFVMLMFLISFTSFITEIFFNTDFFGPGIANTAHLAGALIGYLLGFSKFFRTEQ